MREATAHARTLLLGLSILLFVSCSPGKGTSGVGELQSAAKDREPWSDQGADNQEPADLVVYSPHPDDIIEFVVKEFRQRTGLQVRHISGGTGELIDRLSREVKNPQSDVFWGGGVESLEKARAYFSPYQSSEDGAIPLEFKDPDRYWTGLSLIPMIIIYNSRLVPESQIPRRWADLTQPFFRGRVAYADPARSGSAYTALVTMLRAFSASRDGVADGALGSAASWSFVTKLKRDAMGGSVVDQSENVFSGVAVGEWFAGISFESSALFLRRRGSDVGCVYPQEGTCAVPDGVAIVAGAPHREAAEEFVDFVLGRDVQAVVADRWCRRSVRGDVDAPTGAPPLSELSLLRYDQKAAAREKDRILAKWSQLP